MENTYIKDDSYIPKVGDLVEITNSDMNFSSGMQEYVGAQLIIKSFDNCASYKGDDIYITEFVNPPEGMKSWKWIYEHGHYKYIKKKVKKLRLTLS